MISQFYGLMICQLEDHFEDAEKKVKSWAKALKAQRGETEDQDETEVIS